MDYRLQGMVYKHKGNDEHYLLLGNDYGLVINESFNNIEKVLDFLKREKDLYLMIPVKNRLGVMRVSPNDLAENFIRVGNFKEPIKDVLGIYFVYVKGLFGMDSGRSTYNFKQKDLCSPYDLKKALVAFANKQGDSGQALQVCNNLDVKYNGLYILESTRNHSLFKYIRDGNGDAYMPYLKVAKDYYLSQVEKFYEKDKGYPLHTVKNGLFFRKTIYEKFDLKDVQGGFLRSDLYDPNIENFYLTIWNEAVHISILRDDEDGLILGIAHLNTLGVDDYEVKKYEHADREIWNKIYRKTKRFSLKDFLV